MQMYTELPSDVSPQWQGIKVFHVRIEAGGDSIDLYNRTKLTRRQIRQERRKFRNYTLEVFDDFGPDPLEPNMHRMKGARQAYARRAKNA